MPVGETVSGFFDDEYNRFMKGLARMGRTDQERLFAMTARDVRNSTLPRVVQMPGWGDVIHLRPRLQVTKEQRDEYYAARRQKRDPQLAPEVIHEIDRRRAQLDAMQRSPQPEFDRAWGSVMTSIDNVQDFLASVSVLGRIALTVGSRVGLMAIPGLGPLTAAASILSLAMALGQIAFPAFLLLCQGPRAALRAGLGTALTAGAFKGMTGLAARASGQALGWQFAKTSATTVYGPKGWQIIGRSAFPKWTDPRVLAGALGAALVVAQTTDQLYGYGLSLGPVVGGTMGAAYAAEAALRGEQIEFRASPSVEHFGPRVKDKLAALSGPELRDRLRAAEIVSQAALILDARSPAPVEERLATVLALLPAIGTLERDWYGTGWQDDLPFLLNWQAPPPARAVGFTAWQDYLDPGEALPRLSWPVSWGGEGYDTPLAAPDVTAGVTAGLGQLHQAVAGLDAASALGVAINDGASALWRLWLDDDDGIRPHLTPAWLAAERFTAAGILPHPGNDEHRFATLWNEAQERITNRRHALQTAEEWTALYDKHQLDYIRVGPGPATA